MARFCSECGAALVADAKFCSACGSFVQRAVDPSPAPVSASVAEPRPLDVYPQADEYDDENASPFHQPDTAYFDPQFENDAVPTPPMLRFRPWLIGGAALAALAMVVWFYNAGSSGPSTDYSLNQSTADGANLVAPVFETADQKALFAVTAANVRDKPTVEGSQIVSKLTRGDRLAGTVVAGLDGTSRWLKLTEERGFVALSNLAETEPPLLATIVGKMRYLGDDTSIYAAPDEKSPKLQSVSKGLGVQLVGVTSSGFGELALRKGGVGYLAPASVTLLSDKAPDPDALVQISPDTCDFGGGMQAYFARAEAMAKRRFAEANAKSYDSEDAKSDALEALDAKSIYLPVGKTWRGLTISAIGLHQDSSALYFSDSKDKVKAALTAAGFGVDDNGRISKGAGATGTLTSIYDSGADERAHGATGVACGALG